MLLFILILILGPLHLLLSICLPAKVILHLAILVVGVVFGGLLGYAYNFIVLGDDARGLVGGCVE